MSETQPEIPAKEATNEIGETEKNEPIKTDEPINQPANEQATKPASDVLPPHLQGQVVDNGTIEGEDEQMNVDESEPVSEAAPNPEDPRPNALLLLGVNTLNTKEIKWYIDHYIRPDYSFQTRDKYTQFSYKLEWVNDNSLNIVFTSKEKGAEGAQEALKLLTDESIDADSIPSTQERIARTFVRGEDDEQANNDNSNNPEPEQIIMSVRQSLYGDKKVKNARVYSRYYLLHGEPERTERMPAARNRYRGRRYGYRAHGKDLITGEELAEPPRRDSREYSPRRGGDDREDDLFAGRNFRDVWRPEDDNRGRRGGRRSRRRRRGRYDEDDLYYRSSRDDERDIARRRQADKEDLFPDFFKKGNEEKQDEEMK